MMIAVTGNNIADVSTSERLCRTLPHDFDLSLTVNGSIPEEPAAPAQSRPEHEVLSTEDSSYESAEDIPNGFADIKTVTAFDDVVSKQVEAVSMSERLSSVWKHLVSVAAGVLLLVTVVIVAWINVAADYSINQNE